MARALWNGKVIAESETTETGEGNVYFPEPSLKPEYFRPSSTTSTCPWKGQARYLSLLIDGNENPDAAWYYPDPKPAARRIKGFVAFWRGVEVEKKVVPVTSSLFVNFCFAIAASSPRQRRTNAQRPFPAGA